ncbi:MAG TPA: TIGR03435 family protein [Bryobacteraceae bacterium]|nr:TIGR03435 family protein [Bryobacteraceae bacterium]
MRAIVLLLICPLAVLCQEKLEFEVVSVKPSAPSNGRGPKIGCHGGPGTDDPTLLVCQNLSLLGLVGSAYGVNSFQISTPQWMKETQFDIRARVPPGTAKTQLGSMWENMLADRFKLGIHRETREIQSYVLALAKGGPKFKTKATSEDGNAAAADEAAVNDVGRRREGLVINRGLCHLYASEMTMARLAGLMVTQLRGPVRDVTGLDGKYEIDLHWAGDVFVDASQGEAGPRLADALRDQLGLRLVSKKGPVEFIVVDHCERVPSDN